MKNKFITILLLIHSFITADTACAPAVAMSQEYGTATRTIKTSLIAFKDPVIDALEMHKEDLQKAIKTQGFLVISDIGCFDGSNFFEPLQEVIAKIRKLCGFDFTIKVIYSDLSKRPGSFCQKMIENPNLLGTGVEVSYCEHNFYSPLPYLSNVTFCTLGTHWLSQAPSSGSYTGTIFPTCCSLQSMERKEAEQIAKADLEAFLQARMQDTSILVGLVNMVRIDQGAEKVSFTAQAAMRLMDHVFQEMQQEEASGFIPFYYRLPEDFLAAADSLGYRIERAQTVIFPCDYVQAYKEGKISRLQLAAAETKMARAWSEGSVASLVGLSQVGDFYARLERCFEVSAETCGSDYHLQFLVLGLP